LTSKIIQGIPTLEKAKLLFEEAERINPGPWIGHCKNVAESARLIAENCNDLDSEVAYVLGLLHDIGKRTSNGKTTIGHITEGYNIAMENGHWFLAKICVTHSCPSKNISDIYEVSENNKNEGYNFIKDYLNSAEYDDYDRLIQLCDALGLHNGFTLIEKRLFDVALRHGVHEYTIPKWKAFMELKDYFEKKIGKSIYSILPGIIENTFEFEDISEGK
jgi:putative nucleotidyltransferase with HDIG domain